MTSATRSVSTFTCASLGLLGDEQLATESNCIQALRPPLGLSNPQSVGTDSVCFSPAAGQRTWRLPGCNVTARVS